RPHVEWKKYCRNCLDEFLHHEDRCITQAQSICVDCTRSSVADPGAPLYRCKDCFGLDLVCSNCCLHRHEHNFLHTIEYWNGSFFKCTSFQSLGFILQLNHVHGPCPVPVNTCQDFKVLNLNGIHNITVRFCGCSKQLPHNIQLLWHQLYPSTQVLPHTCATFRLLELFHMLMLTSKVSTYDFYRALEKLTSNTGLNVPKSRYPALLHIGLQWHHLKLLRHGGHAHDPTGIAGTHPSELAVPYPSCPHASINLPEDWKTGPKELR
ncbi:hypothetical protein HYDPIDRAFT_91709, partial [Hydnomerulius pinastri MD-312]